MRGPGRCLVEGRGRCRIQGDPSGEAEYTFTDESITPGTQDHYILEEVDSLGKASFRGPALVLTRG